METKLLRLIDVFPDWASTGGAIMTSLANMTDPPPWSSAVSGDILDLEYYGNNSGDKLISPLVRRMLDTDEHVPAASLAKLSAICMAMFGESWSREWDTMLAVYDPIENYAMTERLTNDKTVDQKGTTQTLTPGLTVTRGTTVHGFNSSDGEPSGGETETTSGQQTVTDTGQDTKTRNYLLTRAGNIGVTTSQQMLQSERDLWRWSYFLDVVFPDLDRILTLRTY